MNRFNVDSTMRRLVATIASMFIGMTIPAMVFKACDYMLKNSIDGNVSDFSGEIMTILTGSSFVILEIAKYMVLFIFAIAALKSIQSGDVKKFGKDMVYILLGYALMQFARFIPFAIPSMMRYMGYL